MTRHGLNPRPSDQGARQWLDLSETVRRGKAIKGGDGARGGRGPGRGGGSRRGRGSASPARRAGGLQRALDLGVIDAIIDPAQTRQELARVIAEAPQLKGHHANIPL